MAPLPRLLPRSLNRIIFSLILSISKLTLFFALQSQHLRYPLPPSLRPTRLDLLPRSDHTNDPHTHALSLLVLYRSLASLSQAAGDLDYGNEVIAEMSEADGYLRSLHELLPSIDLYQIQCRHLRDKDQNKFRTCSDNEVVNNQLYLQLE